jgi:hypothetical protein
VRCGGEGSTHGFIRSSRLSLRVEVALAIVDSRGVLGMPQPEQDRVGEVVVSLRIQRQGETPGPSTMRDRERRFADDERERRPERRVAPPVNTDRRRRGYITP